MATQAQRKKKTDARFLMLKKQGFRMFVASKTGSNKRGDGAMRSVVLAKMPNERRWRQHTKFWGPRNEIEAREYVAWFNNLKETP